MSYIDTKAVKKRLGFGVNSEVQRLFTNECAREMNEFVPKDIGILRMLIDIGYDYIEYQSPYAHYQYIGEKYVVLDTILSPQNHNKNKKYGLEQSNKML